jgi:hypothetical protein
VPKLITIPIAKEIEAVLSGLKPAEVSPPSAQRLSNAAQRPALRGYASADGSGGFAILLALFFGERRRGAAGGSMQIPQICAAAQRFCNPNVVMDPKVCGWAHGARTHACGAGGRRMGRGGARGGAHGPAGLPCGGVRQKGAEWCASRRGCGADEATRRCWRAAGRWMGGRFHPW